MKRAAALKSPPARIIARVLLPHDELGAGMPVVLLHAGVADRGMWKEHVAAIADAGHRVIAVALPGIGEAPVAPQQEPWADVLQTMDALRGRPRSAGRHIVWWRRRAPRRGRLARARHGARVGVGPPLQLEPSAELQAAWDREESPLARGDIEPAVGAVVEARTLLDAPPSAARPRRDDAASSVRGASRGGRAERGARPAPGARHSSGRALTGQQGLLGKRRRGQ